MTTLTYELTFHVDGFVHERTVHPTYAAALAALRSATEDWNTRVYPDADPSTACHGPVYRRVHGADGSFTGDECGRWAIATRPT